MSRILILGAGGVGVNVALLLDRLGFAVQLLDSAPDILQGSPKVCLINHGDGFEYYKPGHRRTGQGCVDGSIVKCLFYPIAALQTSVCTRERPIRFLVSSASARDNSVPMHGFVQNSFAMKTHFTSQFNKLKIHLGCDDDELEKLLGRKPEYFTHNLEKSELADLAEIHGGCAGSSFGINMAHYFALVQAALRSSTVSVTCGVRIETIERSEREFIVHAGGLSFHADQVLITAGHHIPALASRARGFTSRLPADGTYYLNSMTFLRLPATRDLTRQLAASRINFTLQQENGSMFASIIPPREDRDGWAATYFPSPTGSQLTSHKFDPNSPTEPPSDWDDLIAGGLPSEHPNVLATFAQACRYYPFLSDYAEVAATCCQSVFNASSPDSPFGLDRRVRDFSNQTSVLTADGAMSSWAAPKWTSVELTALLAVEHVCKVAGGPSLPRHGVCRLGPTDLDVATIAGEINFRSIVGDLADAVRYAALQGFPSGHLEEPKGRGRRDFL